MTFNAVNSSERKKPPASSVKSRSQCGVVDVKRAQEMLNYEWIKTHKEWVGELERMIKSRKKLEQDALQGPRLTFVGEYIKDKIKNNIVLP